MATVPSTHTFVTGTFTSSDANTFLRDPINYLLKRPLCQVRSSTGQTLTTAVSAAITFELEDVDQDFNGTATQHSTVSNTSRFTANYAGWYSLGGGVGFAANATGVRLTFWAVNGTAVNASLIEIASAGGAVVTAVPARDMVVFLNVGDFVELNAQQTSGGNLSTVTGAGSGESHMTVRWESN